jgi:hypothetical protein
VRQIHEDNKLRKDREGRKKLQTKEEKEIKIESKT